MIDHSKIAGLRIEYAERPLNETVVDKNPFKQFSRWFDEAVAAELHLANAMALATSTPDGKPSVRMVLLKQADPNGFVFFTNYESRKGKELLANPHAALNIYWGELERQVRVEGTTSELSPKECDEYFASRPRGSQIGAWASAQSEIIEGISELEQNVKRIESLYRDKSIPRPPYWGGFCLLPNVFEFWQGRPNRLHDRILYTLQSDGLWIIARLSP
jgi:pyridoxamine 5'-phosphate oxidase